MVEVVVVVVVVVVRLRMIHYIEGGTIICDLWKEGREGAFYTE